MAKQKTHIGLHPGTESAPPSVVGRKYIASSRSSACHPMDLFPSICNMHVAGESDGRTVSAECKTRTGNRRPRLGVGFTLRAACSVCEKQLKPKFHQQINLPREPFF